MPKDFLLEIATEPLPARFIGPALEQLKERLAAALKASRLHFKSVQAYGTLRRLAVVVESLADKSLPSEETFYGPPAERLKDSAGAYTLAATGFARKYGVKPADLKVENGKLAVSRTQPGEPAAGILAAVIPGVIARLEFPKTMTWVEPSPGKSPFRFGRPIRSLVALHGKAVLPLELAGVKSGRVVLGLPALGQKAVLPLPARYRAALKKLLVLADPGERRQVLVERLRAAAKAAGARLDLDEALVEETVWMTEQPTPVVGRFEPGFLDLPAPLLSLVMKKQLKFFPLLDGARLKAAFVGVRDGPAEGQALVREGYQRVLAARLSDAAFFFARDKARTLESRLPELSRVAYQTGLGSVADKAVRVEEIAHWLLQQVRSQRPSEHEEAVHRIARLCYADLVTDVVKEFPELQGVMGGVYARHEGMDERVALGLEQFYLPLGPKSPVPATLEGALASLAGKLDSLAGHFALGQVPTGSADPFALRRQALGASRIVLEKQLPIDLEDALAKAISIQPPFYRNDDAVRRGEVLGQLADFVWARLQAAWEDMGFRTDEVRSVRAGGLKNLPRTMMRLLAVRAVRRHPDFEPLAAAFKRASNILKQAKAESNGPAPERERLKEEAELALYDALTHLESQVHDKLAAGGYEESLRALVAVKPRLDAFFDTVMVMADDQDLKRQRLALLSKLVRLFKAVADLAELQPAAN